MTPAFDCPRCGEMLTMSERQGIEIDYCPQCRGVWLDRGELDKIIERAEPVRPPPPPQQQPWRAGGRDRDDGRDGYHQHGKKRKGWLGELFD